MKTLYIIVSFHKQIPPILVLVKYFHDNTGIDAESSLLKTELTLLLNI